MKKKCNNIKRITCWLLTLVTIFSFTVPAFATNEPTQTYTEVVGNRTLSSQYFVDENSVIERFTISRDGIVSSVVEKVIYSDGHMLSYVDGVLVYEAFNAPYGLFLNIAQGNYNAIPVPPTPTVRLTDPCPFWESVHYEYGEAITYEYGIGTQALIDGAVSSICALILGPILGFPEHTIKAIAILEYLSKASEDEGATDVIVTHYQYRIFPEYYDPMICNHVYMATYRYSTPTTREYLSSEWTYYQVHM